MEILTAQEVAALLKISKRQVYELAKQAENPIPSDLCVFANQTLRLGLPVWLRNNKPRDSPYFKARAILSMSRCSRLLISAFQRA